MARELDETKKTLVAFVRTMSAVNNEFSPPSTLERIFPHMILFGVGSFLLYRVAAGSAAQLKDYLSDNRIVIENFIEDYVQRPVREIYHTIRYKESKLSILRPEELETEIKTLEDMVGSFAREQLVSKEALTGIAEQTTKGDISFVMSRYEKEMRAPVKNLVFGNMLRLMLIQVQGVKVDAALALSSLDKLLKSNELNFAFLSAIPAGAVFLGLSYQFSVFFPNRSKSATRRLYETVRYHLRKIHMLLNHFEGAITNPDDLRMVERQGALISEVALLHSRVTHLPEREMSMLQEDLADIETTTLTISQRLETIHRIYLSLPNLTVVS